jgi:hypothetical protein
MLRISIPCDIGSKFLFKAKIVGLPNKSSKGVCYRHRGLEIIIKITIRNDIQGGAKTTFLPSPTASTEHNYWQPSGDFVRGFSAHYNPSRSMSTNLASTH